MNRYMRILAASVLCALMGIGGAVFAAEYDLEQEIGQPLSSVDADTAKVLLTWYAEGKILAFAPKQSRIELLRRIVEVSPPDSSTQKRAELLLQSAETSHWS